MNIQNIYERNKGSGSQTKKTIVIMCRSQHLYAHKFEQGPMHRLSSSDKHLVFLFIPGHDCKSSHPPGVYESIYYYFFIYFLNRYLTRKSL